MGTAVTKPGLVIITNYYLLFITYYLFFIYYHISLRTYEQLYLAYPYYCMQ